MSYSEQVKADAKKAAHYIREHGWCRLVMEHGECVCALGAMRKVVGRDEFFDGDLHNAFREETGVHAIGYEFNDTPGRTKEDVIAVFDKIANS